MPNWAVSVVSLQWTGNKPWQIRSCCVLHAQKSRRTNSVSSIDVAGHNVPISKSLKLLGVTLDAHLTFNEHVNNTCRAAFYHLRALRHIRSSLTDEMDQTVACAVVHSRLDYCNSLYVGTGINNWRRDVRCQFCQLQRVQNLLAKIVTSTRKHDHITPVLNRLHWLPVRQRVMYANVQISEHWSAKTAVSSA